MSKKVVLTSMYMLENMHTTIDVYIREIDGKKFTAFYHANAPILIRNYTGRINVSVVGNKLVIDDGGKS